MGKRIGIIAVMLLAVLCLAGCSESNEAKYDRAQKLLSDGKYEEAAGAFDALGDYSDAARMAAYGRAVAAAEAGNYQTALAGFTALGDYQDCPMRVTYYTARQPADPRGADV